MKRSILVILSCFFVVALTARYGFAQSENSIKGKTLYTNKCQFCHGIRGDGKGPAAEPLMRHPADFTDPKFWQKDIVEKIDVTLKSGKEMMPAFDLKPDDIKAITWYISHTFKKETQYNK